MWSLLTLSAGFVCAECIDGWYASLLDALSCKKCPNTAASIAVFLILPAVLYGFALYMSRDQVLTLRKKQAATAQCETLVRSWSNRSLSDKLNEEADMVSPSFKILIVHATILRAVGPVEWSWQSTSDALVSTQQAPSGSITELDPFCAFGWGFDGKVWFYIISPVAGAMVALVLAVLVSKIMAIARYNTLKMFITSGLYMFSSQAISKMLLVFPCYKVAGSWKMIYDPISSCDDHADLKLITSVALAIYLLAVFYVLGYQFWRSKEIITSPIWESNKSETAVFAYGFLFQGYKERYFFWEMTIVVRKFLILAIAIWFPPATNMLERTLALCLLILTSLVGTSRCRPYSESSVNLIDTVTQAASLASVILAIYVEATVTSDDATSKKNMATLLFLLINMFLLALHFRMVAKPAYAKLLKIVRKLKVFIRRRKDGADTLEGVSNSTHEVEGAAAEPSSGVPDFHVDVAPSISIADLKDSLASKCGVEVAEMDLTYGGQVLETTRTLNDCIGSSGRTLQLVPRPAKSTVHVEMNPIRANEDSAIQTPKTIINI